LKKLILGLSIIGCCLLAFMMSCNEKNNSSKIADSDSLVDIRTHKLRVILSDTPSEYTIVLESGGGQCSDAYQEIQDTLAVLTGTRVMSYDRSGFGRSELGPDNLDAIGEVDALKKCLEVQGFRDKYILVGHSYGGFLVQLFTLRYPELVSGLVLIDPMNVKFVDRFGLDNLNAVTPYFEGPSNDFEKACNRVVDHFPEAIEALRGKELPTQIPVILITVGNPPLSDIMWRECHREMVMGSDKHVLLIAEGNSHNVVHENPELVVKTIAELVGRIKSE